MRLLLTIGILLVAGSLNAQTPILNENFTGYPNGDLTSAQGWTMYNSGSTPFIQIKNATPLTYPGYTAGDSYISVAPQSAGAGRSSYKNFSPAPNDNSTSTTIFYSFLVRVNSAVVTSDIANYSVSLRYGAGGSPDNSVGRFSITKNASNQWQFGVSAGNNSGTISYFNTATTSTSTVFLILIRYDIKPNANDAAYMWVNPNLDNEPAVETASASSLNGNVSYGPQLDALMVFQRDYHFRPGADFDAFRVSKGTTSASAFSNLGVANTGPACATPTGQPTNLSFNYVGRDSVAGSFTGVSPTTSYLVVRTTGATPSSPVNGTNYTAGSSALGGTIVYSGPASDIRSGGLSSFTNHSYFVYAYNSSGCSGGPVYLTTGPLTGTVKTKEGSLLLQDNFTTYTNGDLNGQGSWTAYSSGSAPRLQVENNSPMTYPDYESGGAYISTRPIADGDGKSSYKLFAKSISNLSGAPNFTFYYSFLVRVSDAVENADRENYTVSLRNAPGAGADQSAGRFSIMKNAAGQWQFGISAGNNTGSISYYNTNTTSTTQVFLILIRYDLNTSGNDAAYMWVNPSGPNEPSTASANASSTNGNVAIGDKIDALMVFNRNIASRPTAQFDAFRVAGSTSSAEAWASLTAPLAVTTRKLAIIGSSTSACVGPTNSDSCYTKRVQYYYTNTLGRPLTLDNLAVGGTNPYQAMPTNYTPPLGRPSTNTSFNISKAIQGNPNAIIVNFPSNGFCEYSVAEIMNCFRIMKSAANAAGIPCYITTTQPREEGCFLTDQMQLKMTEIKDSILQQFGGYAIDFYTRTADPYDSTILDAYDADDIHLNNAGHRILAEQVIAADIFGDIALPLRFISFTGRRTKNDVSLEWKTSEETTLKEFHVERSSNGRTFNSIGRVNANGGDQNNYKFVDQTNDRDAYYRVVAIDLDGKKSLTRVIRLSVRPLAFDVERFVVGDGKVVIEMQAKQQQQLTVDLINVLGQTVATKVVKLEKGYSTIQMSLLKASGIHYLRFHGLNNQQQTIKMLLP